MRPEGAFPFPSMQSDQTPFVPAWFFNHGLSLAEIGLLCYLWRRRNSKSGQCNPSASTIAADVKIGRKTVFRMLAHLEAKGLVERKSGHTGQSNQYQLKVLRCTSSQDDTSGISTTSLVAETTLASVIPTTKVGSNGLLQGTERTNLNKVHKGSGWDGWNEPPEKQRERERRHTSELLAKFFPDRCLSADDWRVNEDVPFGGPQAIHRVTGEIVESEQCA